MIGSPFRAALCDWHARWWGATRRDMTLARVDTTTLKDLRFASHHTYVNVLRHKQVGEVHRQITSPVRTNAMDTAIDMDNRRQDLQLRRPAPRQALPHA
jgi:hypothetical protein